MQFELVKYKYGKGPAYTAFCVAAGQANKKHRGQGGSHFQRSETAREYLDTIGQDASIYDWSILPGTVPFPSSFRKGR
jgi:hypothetical protein